MMEEIEETVRRIKDLEIQGASNIAKESLKVLKNYVEENGFDEHFEEAAKKLKNARPTGVSVHNCIEYIMRKKSVEAMDEISSYIDSSKEKSAQNASELIKNGDIVMTHCHSSTVMKAFKKAKEDGKNFKVIVTETEPKLQGLKTAKELVDMDIPIYYIVDSAAGMFMWAADSAFVGVDAVRGEGILNKIGTYMMSLAANEDSETEFYVVGTKDKFDYDNFSQIEERSPKEIRNIDELDGDDVKVENPAFDLTPWSYIDALITEDGKIQKEEAIDILTGEFDP